MKKLRKILLLILLLPLLGAALSPVDLNLNGKFVEETPLLEKQGELFIPIEPFSKLTSLQFREKNKGDIILFRDNVFIKFNTNSSTYFLNGKEFTWKNPPFVENGELYLPYRILLDFMNFQYSYNAEKKLLELATGTGYDVSLSYRQNRQKVDFAEAKISYNLPYFWKRTSLNSFSSLENSLKIEVSSRPLGEEKPADAIKRLVEEKSFDDFEKRTPRQLFVEATSIANYGYVKKEQDLYYYYGLSYFTLENRLIETAFCAQGATLEPILKLEEDILSSAQFNAYTIDDMQEHYVELEAFTSLKMSLDDPLYANMLVDNTLAFKGEINPSIKELHATVKRGDRRFYHSFAVKEGKFDTSIPIPFGLGFHSLSIALSPPPEEESRASSLPYSEDKNILLRFSLLNTSLDEGLYLSYSNLVPTQREEIGILSYQVRNKSFDYYKAEALLSLLKENFSLGKVDDPLLALEEKTLSKKSAALIYAALLRRAGVPTQVISNISQTIYGVEILSNGRWIVIDPYRFLLNEDPPLEHMSLDQDHFGTRAYYYDF